MYDFIPSLLAICGTGSLLLVVSLAQDPNSLANLDQVS